MTYDRPQTCRPMTLLLLTTVHRLTDAHKSAIRVMRRIRYFVAKRKFQVRDFPAFMFLRRVIYNALLKRLDRTVGWVTSSPLKIRRNWGPSLETFIWTILSWSDMCIIGRLNRSVETRSSADADNRLDAFSGQSRSTNMVPFHMLHIFSYCAIVTLSWYSSSKNFMTLKWGSKINQGHWEWYHSIDCVWFPISVL